MASRICSVAAALLVATGAGAQTWSVQERELLTQVEACWAAADVSHENWVRVCNPAEDMVYWWAAERTPVTGDAWWSATYPQWDATFDRLAWNVRPLQIRFHNDVGVIHYYWIQQLRRTADGVIVPEEGIVMELYRKVDGRWQYLGGLGAPSGGS